MGQDVWQRCPRCESRRVRIEDKKEYGMGRFVRLLMEGSGFITFMFTFIFITVFLTIITKSMDFSLMIGLISAVVATIYVVKRFKGSSGGKIEHILFCKDCELRFSK